MDKFIFKGYEEDLKSGIVKFSYVIVRNGQEITLNETLKFNPVESIVSEPLIKNALDSLHLALGVSYWKLYCPKAIETPNIVLSKSQAEFWNTIYTNGLGEFYYKNKLDFHGLVSFPYSETASTETVSIPRQNRSLVGIGGGKDSIVAAELLKKAGKDITGFILNSTPLQEKVVERLDIESISMERHLDPQLFELNKQSDTYNGHIPISTIYAFVALLAAIIYDFKYIIVSNEKSSNYGNVEYLGEQINHQWSKSLEFEELFQKYTKSYITPDITYFSLLRGLYEIKITEMFTNYPGFFPIFSSCNTNFKQNHEQGQLWCGKCAKCAFVFALLAGFLPKEAVISIFGQNLFSKNNLIPVYKELLGMKDIKPFDCVGTPEEVKLAFLLSHKNGEYNNDPIMQLFEKEVLPDLQTDENNLLDISEETLPEEFKGIL